MREDAALALSAETSGRLTVFTRKVHDIDTHGVRSRGQGVIERWKEGPLVGSILARCEGFAVHTQLARVGTVEAVTIRPAEEPSSLTVRAGLVGSWLLEVPLDQIAEVMPRERRIILRPGGLVERVRRPDEPSSSSA